MTIQGGQVVVPASNEGGVSRGRRVPLGQVVYDVQGDGPYGTGTVLIVPSDVPSGERVVVVSAIGVDALPQLLRRRAAYGVGLDAFHGNEVGVIARREWQLTSRRCSAIASAA